MKPVDAKNRSALRIAIIYASVSAVWILLSDLAIFLCFGSFLGVFKKSYIPVA
ncbi:MAG: hypothetical protein Q7N50_13840 [Armatimonadota bacterium]|nr:hypothetical protein [Armatimonadota bacterium]